MSFLRRTVLSRRAFAYVTGGTALGIGSGYWYLNSGPVYPVSTIETRRPPPTWTPPSREEMLTALRSSSKNKRDDEFDILITMNMQAEIDTVGQLVATIAKLKKAA